MSSLMAHLMKYLEDRTVHRNTDGLFDGMSLGLEYGI